MDFRETSDGLIYSDDSVLVFFGKKSCTLERLQTLYPDLKFRGVKQTHSNISVKSFEGSGAIEADAHWTQEKNVALLIKTADCLPIMIHQPESKTIMAIHAGWRGVANQIAPLSMEKLNTDDECEIFIGPHIMQNSFEVQNDAKELLVNSAGSLSTEEYLNNDGGQMHIDLQKIVLHQLSNFKIGDVKSTIRDTKSNPDFHSYRRDLQNSGRNLSFICLLT